MKHCFVNVVGNSSCAWLQLLEITIPRQCFLLGHPMQLHWRSLAQVAVDNICEGLRARGVKAHVSSAEFLIGWYLKFVKIFID